MFSIHHVLFQIERCCSTNHCIFLKAHSKKLAVPARKADKKLQSHSEGSPSTHPQIRSDFLSFRVANKYLCEITQQKSTVSLSTYFDSTCIGNLITSMYGRSTYIWLIFIVDVGKYTIHWWYENCPILTFIVSFLFAHHGSPPLAILSL